MWDKLHLPGVALVGVLTRVMRPACVCVAPCKGVHVGAVLVTRLQQLLLQRRCLCV